jgi:hypothetical protein
MSRRSAVQSVALLLSFVAVLAVLATPVGASVPAASHAALTSQFGPAIVDPSRASSLRASAAPAAISPSAVRPDGALTLGGRVYQTSETPITGNEQYSTVAIDNATGTVFALSYDSATLTAFNAYSGALDRVITFSSDAANWYDSGLVYDNITNQLFVGWVDNASDGWLTILNATTFAYVGNVSFADSWVPTFTPDQLLFVPLTNTIFIENESTNDVMVLNASNDSLATFDALGCEGTTEYGDCTSSYQMFYDNASGTPVVIVPEGSTFAPALFVEQNATYDTPTLGGFTSPSLESFLGAGAFDPTFGAVYFANATGDGTVMAFADTGAFIENYTNGAFYVDQITVDPTTEWIVECGYNASGVGPQLTGINPFSVGVGWQFQGGPEDANGYIYNFALAALANGTSYAVTAGGEAGSDLLVQLPNGSLSQPPFTVLHYATMPVLDDDEQPVSDPATGDVYWFNGDGPSVLAQSESTGTSVWGWMIPPGGEVESLTVDAAASAVYVFVQNTSGTNLYALSATTGAVELNQSMTYSSYSISSGENHLLYVADEANDTIQVYSNGGSASSLTWTATLSLPTGTQPCSLAASPVAEVVALETCGLGFTAEIASVATHGVVDYFNGTEIWWNALAFNATGALYIGGELNVTVLAAGTWAFAKNITALFPVYFLEFAPQVGGLVLSGDAYESPVGAGLAVVSESTGATLGVFAPSAPVVAFGSDGTNGVLAAVLTTGQTFLATLVSLPGTPSALEVAAGNTTLEASWGAATGAIGYPVTGYTVLWGTAVTGPWTTFGTVTATSDTLTGLTDGSTYYVTVRATSGSGTGATATPMSGVPAGVPYPPIALTAGAATSSSLAFSWSAPSSDGGAAVTSYTLEYATSASGPWTPAAQGSALSGTLTGLSSGTKYYVEVDAVNSQGTGHASASVTASTSSSSTGSSGLPGGSTLVLGVAVLVVIVVALLVVGLVMMRRRGGGSGSPPAGGTSPPAGASGGASGPTAPPPPPSS